MNLIFIVHGLFGGIKIALCQREKIKEVSKANSKELWR